MNPSDAFNRLTTHRDATKAWAEQMLADTAELQRLSNDCTPAGNEAFTQFLSEAKQKSDAQFKKLAQDLGGTPEVILPPSQTYIPLTLNSAQIANPLTLTPPQNTNPLTMRYLQNTNPLTLNPPQIANRFTLTPPQNTNPLTLNSAQTTNPLTLTPPRPITYITIKYDVGFGNFLSICGTGPNMSWDPEKAVRLRCVENDTWVYETHHTFEKFEYKILINNKIWEEGSHHDVDKYHPNQITPRFI